MRIDWIAKLRHLLQTLAFCLAIAAIQVAFDPVRSYGVAAAFSLTIGTLTWALIDFGTHLFPSSKATGWPAGWTGLALPVGGIVLGFVDGSWLNGRAHGATVCATNSPCRPSWRI